MMKARFLAVISSFLMLTGCGSYSEDSSAVTEMLPLTLDMSELNGNEKYYYLDTSLPSSPEKAGHISEGDIMLYGDNCLVVFYESFDTSYSYTKIGHISDTSGLADALGTGGVTVTFETNGSYDTEYSVHTGFDFENKTATAKQTLLA